MIPGIHYIEADSFEDLITKAIELMNNFTIQQKLAQNARSLFKIDIA